jgi:exosortase E/protease (VPEID-CTERM system)
MQALTHKTLLRHSMLWVVLLLVLEAVLLRYLRWLAIETAIPFLNPALSSLVSHRDVVKAVLFGVLGLGMLFSKDLTLTVVRERLFVHRSWHVGLVVNFTFFLLLSLTLWALPSMSIVGWLSANSLVYFGLYALFALMWLGLVCSAFLLLMPWAMWRSLLLKNLAGVAVITVFVLIYVLMQSYLSSFENFWSGIFLQPTIYIAIQFSHLMGMAAVAQTGSTYFGTTSFVVDIGPTCLGYQGVSIILLSLSGYCLIHKHHLRFPNVLVVLPGAVLLLLMLNALRIAILVAVGNSWSPEVAVMGFHSTAGWVELILTLGGGLYLINRYDFFTYTPLKGVINNLVEDEIYLFPQVALIGTSFLTQMGTGSFYWAYPVPIAVAAVVLWLNRKRYPAFEFGVPVLAGLTGIAVFMVWVVLIPSDLHAATNFREHLFSVPPGIVGLWLLFRLLGAVLIVPLVEELAFRAFLLPLISRSLSKILSPWLARGLALVISALVFGVLHSAWIAGILAGLAYGLVYLLRGKIFDAVLAHAMTNLMLALYVLLLDQWSYW